MSRFDDQVVIVTGAAHGIGAATAERFAAEGAKVLAVDVHSNVEDVASKLKQNGAAVVARKADVAQEADVRDCVRAAVSEFGKLNVVVNNAGITLPKPLRETTVEEWDRVQKINLRSIFLFLREAAEDLIKTRGSVVNVASFHAHATISNFSAYAAAKTGILGLTRSAALDFAPDGVRVNCVCPGIIETAMWQAWLAEVPNVDETVREVVALQPLGRIGKPSDVANAIAFLASSEADYITGSTIYVDGGVTARLHHV